VTIGYHPTRAARPFSSRPLSLLCGAVWSVWRGAGCRRVTARAVARLPPALGQRGRVPRPARGQGGAQHGGHAQLHADRAGAGRRRVLQQLGLPAMGGGVIFIPHPVLYGEYMDNIWRITNGNFKVYNHQGHEK
jgi:hypothetical protein